TRFVSLYITLSCSPVSPLAPMAGDRCTVEEQRERWERKRGRTAQELLQTESAYVEELELISKFYDDVFRARCGHLKMAENGICGAIPDILKVNRILLSSLEIGSFGSAFEHFSHSLDLYKTHADRIEPTLLVIKTQIKKNKSFARFMKLQASRPEFGGRGLAQLLGGPLHRLVRYKHYLRDLAENNLPGNSDTSKLLNALGAVSQACQYTEDISNHQENRRQLHRVQKMLKGRSLCVVSPGRWYIREGWLSLVPQKGEEVKQRMLFLFSDVLAVTSPCHPLHPTSAHKFSCRALYPLRECRVERVLGHTQSQGGLISLSFEKEKILLMSSDQKDINDWFQCMVDAVRRFCTAYPSTFSPRKIHSNCKLPQKRQPEASPEGHRPCEQRATKRDRVQHLRDENSIAQEEISSKKRKMANERYLYLRSAILTVT
ncbi:rho guanine nucleotide exchange factor 39, partial [Pelodytes ibericus]